MRTGWTLVISAAAVHEISLKIVDGPSAAAHLEPPHIHSERIENTGSSILERLSWNQLP
jgi:hypothetical protein